MTEAGKRLLANLGAWGIAAPPRDAAAIIAIEAETIDNCIAIVQQSLDTVRGEDDGESRVIRASIGAREHVIRLLTGLRAALAGGSDGD